MRVTRLVAPASFALLFACGGGGLTADRFFGSSWTGTFETANGSGTLEFTVGTALQNTDFEDFEDIPLTAAKVVLDTTSYGALDIPPKLDGLTSSIGCGRGGRECMQVVLRCNTVEPEAGVAYYPDFRSQPAESPYAFGENEIEGVATVQGANGTFKVTRQ